MTSLLQGKNPNLPTIIGSPQYVWYYAEALVGDSGAQVPKELRPAVVATLKTLLVSVKTDAQMQELLDISRKPFIQGFIRKMSGVITDTSDLAIAIARFLRNPNYIQYYAETMVGKYGAQIPIPFHPKVIQDLMTKLPRNIKRLDNLLHTSTHTCVRTLLFNNFRRFISKRARGEFPSEEVANLELFGIIDGTGVMLSKGIVETMNGEFVIDPATGVVTSVTPERISRNEVCQAAIKRGETLALLPKEEGGRRRIRKRKTLRKKKPTKRTKTAKGAR